MSTQKKRCFGNSPGKEFLADYHDNQWGIPEHDDQNLFEMLILEGAQAGLSWETVPFSKSVKIIEKLFTILILKKLQSCLMMNWKFYAKILTLFAID